MSIIKPEIGRQHAVSINVAAIEEIKGQFGQQYQFTTEAGDVLYAPKDALDRQAVYHKLLGITELIGRDVLFWRKPMADNPAKSFWNIEPDVKGSAVAAGASEDDYVARDLRNAGVMPKKVGTFDDIIDTYTNSLGRAVEVAKDFEAFTSGPLSEQGILAIAATLFIERNRKGV